MSLRGKAISGIKWTSASSVVTMLGSILRVAVLTRFLDKADFGLMALVMFVLGFTNLFTDMGLSSAILHKQDISKKQYASLYWLNTYASIVLYLLILAAALPLGAFYGESELPTLLAVMGTGILLSSLGSQFRVIEQKNLNFRYLATVEISTLVLSIGLSIGMAIRGYGVYALVVPSLIQNALANLTFLANGLKSHGLLFHFKWAETKPFLKIGSYRVGSQVINYFNRGLDVLLIGKLLGMEALGPYSIAKQFVFRPTNLINPILTRVASPVLAKFQEDKSVLRDKYLKLQNSVATICIPLYLGIIATAPLFVPILYGPRFSTLVPIIQILSVYMTFRAIGNPIGSLVTATGRTDLAFTWNLVTLLITPAFIVIGAQWGVVEVAIALAASQIVLFVPAWRFLSYRMIGVSLRNHTRSLIPSLAILRQILHRKDTNC